MTDLAALPGRFGPPAAQAEVAARPAPRGVPLTAFELFERLAAGLIILMMSNALIGPVLDPAQNGGANNPILRLMWLPVYGVIVVLLVARIPRFMRFWFPALLLGAMVAYCCISVLWSINPDITQRRMIALVLTTVFGVYLAARFEGGELAELIAGVFLFLAVGSYFVCIAVPSIGIHQDVNAGDWRGLWYEKNAMGAMMVYGAHASVAAAVVAPKRRWLWIASFVLCAALVLMTRSKTSLLVLMVAAAGTVALAFSARHPAFAVLTAWGGAAVAAVIGVLLLTDPGVLLTLIGKDATLTGRTDIWAAVLRFSEEKPLGGYGYAAFWSKPSHPSMWIEHQAGWDVPTAHNGWLDILVNIGWVGVVIMAVIITMAAIAALFRVQRLRDGYWAAMFLIVFLFTSFSESFFLLHNSVQWLFCVAAISRLLGPAPDPARA